MYGTLGAGILEKRGREREREREVKTSFLGLTLSASLYRHEILRPHCTTS